MNSLFAVFPQISPELYFLFHGMLYYSVRTVISVIYYIYGITDNHPFCIYCN